MTIRRVLRLSGACGCIEIYPSVEIDGLDHLAYDAVNRVDMAQLQPARFFKDHQPDSCASALG
jgi:hypothetical protein